MTSRGAPIEWLPLEPAVTQVNPVMLASKAPHPDAARLFYDFVLSKEGQEMLRGFQRIPVRKRCRTRSAAAAPRVQNHGRRSRRLQRLRRVSETVSGDFQITMT